MKRILRIFGILLIIVGLGLLGGAGYLALDNEKREAQQAEHAQIALSGLKDALPKFNENSLPTKIVDGYEYVGILRIPRLGVELPVLSTCVTENLDIAPGLFSGNPYFGNMVIGGHNSEAHLKGLEELEPGDQVTFTDFNDITWKYKMVTNEILKPNQGLDLIQSQYEMSLFNCTWDNSSRFVVRCTTSE